MGAVDNADKDSAERASRLDFAGLALGLAVAFAIWTPSDLAAVRIAVIAVAAATAAVKVSRAFGWPPAS